MNVLFCTLMIIIKKKLNSEKKSSKNEKFNIRKNLNSKFDNYKYEIIRNFLF